LLFIFDWDGTISDSTDKIVRCVQSAAEVTGLPVLSDEAIKNIIGLGLPEAIQCLYPDAEQAQRENLRINYSKHYVSADQKPSLLYPGVMHTLQALQADGHQLAIATGKSRRGLDRILQQLQLDTLFHSSRCADETTSKPYPQMLHELLEELEVSPEASVMIGDTEYDMEMAQRANIRRIAVSYGAHHIDRLKEYEPDLCVDHFGEILSWSYLADSISM
jgi:phosphoglycolate phosphatase